MLFNSTRRNLDLDTGAVSRSILQAAGDTIQREVSDVKPNGLEFGEFVTSSGGNLNFCKMIIHASLCEWDDGKGQAKEVSFQNKNLQLPHFHQVNI